jgi:hypothetical protein
MKVDGHLNFPPLSLFGNQLIDVTLSIEFFGFSWSSEVVSVGGNAQYVGVMTSMAATSNVITKNITLCSSHTQSSPENCLVRISCGTPTGLLMLRFIVILLNIL